MTVVLDASVVLGWILPDEAAQFPVLDRDSKLHVPAVFAYELAHTLQKAYRNKRITLAAVQDGLALVESLPLVLHPPEPGGARAVWLFAASYGVNAYDAAYLGLALELSLPLATTDAQLANAARAAGVTVYVP